MRLINSLLLIFVVFTSCGNVSSDASSTEEAVVEEVEQAATKLTSWVDNPEEDLSGGYNIDFSVKNFDKGNIRLIGVFGKQNYLADSTRAKNGTFSFKGETKLQSGFFFVLFPNNKFFQLLIDSDQEFKVETSYDKFTKKMKISGSLCNELLYHNLNYEDVYKRKLDSVQKLYNALSDADMNKQFYETQRDKLIEDRKKHVEQFKIDYPKNFFTIFKIAGQNPDVEFPNGPDESANEKKFTYRYRKAFWDGVDFSDRRLIRTPVIQNKLDRYFDQLIDRYPDSLIKYADYVTRQSFEDKEMFKYVANYIGVKYKESNIMGGESVFVHMIDNFWTTELAFWSSTEEIEGLRKEADAMKPSLLGKTGQNVVCFDTDGNPSPLYDLTSEIIVLYMYSYECENCRKESPKVLEMYKKWKDKGVDVYAICMDHDKEKWMNYIQKVGMTWHNVWDPDYRSGYHKKYHVDITPELYVLDADKKIVGKNLKADQLETIFDRIKKDK